MVRNETEKTTDTDKIVGKKVWGQINGEDIYLFTITNANGYTLLVSNYGAAVVSFLMPDRDGVISDVVLGYDTPADYQKDSMYVGTVVGRYANRIASGKVIIDGMEYHLSTKPGGYHQHGGLVGFNKKIFYPEPFVKEGKNGIKLFYESPDMEEGFPGNLKLSVTYTLDDQNNWTVEYEASTDKTTLVNLTQHAYFNLTGHQSSSILEHELQIHSEWYLPVNERQVPVGDIHSITGTPFDFNQFRKIGLHIDDDDLQLRLSNGFDHTWVLEKEHTPHLKHAATVWEKQTGRILNVFTTEPSVHFYTANSIEAGTKGKDGAIYNRRNSFCLETQHFPDTPNNPHFPSTLLHAGEKFYSKTIFNFSNTDL